jgi:hypothetical protein
MAARPRFERLARLTGKALLPFWAAAGIAVGGTLMVGHWYTLPMPNPQDAQVTAALNQLRGPDERHSWLLVHFLYAECRCSQRIFEHLLTRGRDPAFAEKMVLIGEHSTSVPRATAAGFAVDVVSVPELAARFHVQSAPLFAVISDTGTLSYLGGYTERKQGALILDQSIASDLRKSKHVASLPLFGCAVSRSLQRALDPLGIKYDQKG